MKAIIRDTKRRLYCGPTAICAVTGVPASKVLDAIETFRGEDAYGAHGHLKGVRGMHQLEVQNTLAVLGFPARYHRLDDRPTLAAWLKCRPPGALIVNVTRHYVAVDGRTFIDSKTKGKPVSLSSAPGRRARVKGYFQLSN